MKRESTASDSNKKLDAGDGIEYLPLCMDEIARVTSSNGALSRKFHAYDLIPVNKKNLHIRCYMDYYGGYAEHARQVVYGLHDTGRYNIKVTNIKTPVDVDPIAWQKNNWFIHNAIDLAKSDFMAIAGPGWLQSKFLPPSRKVYGWTMIESMGFSEECTSWLKNADCIICPTDIDVRRAKEARANNTVKIHLGFDSMLFNQQTEPMSLVGLENRFVFGVLGSWNIRKGVKEIIKAYCHAFSDKDNVTLLLVSKYGNRKWGENKEDKERWTISHEFSEILTECKKFKDNLPHIALVDIPVHETVLPHIMARFDCLVGFSSGESTWLPGLQALAMKIPVIQLANDCCGYMEYLHDKNSFLCKKIDYRVCTEEFWRTTSEYYEGQVFGFGDWEELSATMGEAYIKRDFMLKSRVGWEDVKNWTWKDTIKALDEFLVDMDCVLSER